MTNYEFAGKVHWDMQDRRSARCALRRNDEVNEWWATESASVRPACFFERDEYWRKVGGSSLGKAGSTDKKTRPASMLGTELIINSQFNFFVLCQSRSEVERKEFRIGVSFRNSNNTLYIEQENVA